MPPLFEPWLYELETGLQLFVEPSLFYALRYVRECLVAAEGKRNVITNRMQPVDGILLGYMRLSDAPYRANRVLMQRAFYLECITPDWQDGAENSNAWPSSAVDPRSLVPGRRGDYPPYTDTFSVSDETRAKVAAISKSTIAYWERYRAQHPETWPRPDGPTFPSQTPRAEEVPREN